MSRLDQFPLRQDTTVAARPLETGLTIRVETQLQQYNSCTDDLSDWLFQVALDLGWVDSRNQLRREQRCASRAVDPAIYGLPGTSLWVTVKVAMRPVYSHPSPQPNSEPTIGVSGSSTPTPVQSLPDQQQLLADVYFTTHPHAQKRAASIHGYMGKQAPSNPT
ncbi:hypothetical protein TWF569_000254, partial [Orbilia oligospora]